MCKTSQTAGALNPIWSTTSSIFPQTNVSCCQ